MASTEWIAFFFNSTYKASQNETNHAIETAVNREYADGIN